MADPNEISAEEARFAACMDSTAADERDWIAFQEFEGAIHNATMCAGMINLYDGGPEGDREHAALKLALHESSVAQTITARGFPAKTPFSRATRLIGFCLTEESRYTLLGMGVARLVKSLTRH
jgi:hypothetical protein